MAANREQRSCLGKSSGEEQTRQRRDGTRHPRLSSSSAVTRSSSSQPSILELLTTNLNFLSFVSFGDFAIETETHPKNVFTINHAFLARTEHETRLLNFPSKALFSSRPYDVLLSYQRNAGKGTLSVVLAVSTTKFELESVGAVTKTNEGNANYCFSPIRMCITPW